MKATISRLRILGIQIDEVGPFRDEPSFFSFLRDDEPADIFLLASKNGVGKTTILEAISFLFSLLIPTSGALERAPTAALDRKTARMRLDLLITWDGGVVGAIEPVLVSVGWRANLKTEWTSAEVDEKYPGISFSDHVRLDYDERPDERLAISGQTEHPLVQHLLQEFSASQRAESTSLAGVFDLPCLLYFTTTRDIVPPPHGHEAISRPHDWQFQVVRRFGIDGQSWGGSLDNLFVWLYWLGSDTYLKPMVDRINKVLFGTKANKYLSADIRKDPPSMLVVNEGRNHPISRLSSGEKSLVQLLARTLAHGTRNCVVLIDEAGLHLHPQLQRRWMGSLLELVEVEAGLSVIFTTHSKDMLVRYSPDVQSDAIHKGCQIIPEGF